MLNYLAMGRTTGNAQLFSSAVRYHVAGNLDEAQRLYQEILALEPAHADALSMLGTIQLARGRREEALRLLDSALAVTPRHAVALLNRGNALLELMRLDEAIASYDAALRCNPAFPEAHNNRGLALRRLKRSAEALDAFERAAALSPGSADAHRNRGNALRDLGRFAEALASYDRALQLKPQAAELYAYRSVILGDLERYDEALESCDRAVALAPDNLEAHINRGIALAALQRLDEAIASYDRALAISPSHAAAHNNRAVALMARMRFEEALASCERAIAFEPRFAGAHYTRGAILRELKRPAEALASFDKAAALEPGIAYLAGARLFTRRQLCDWKDLDALFDEVTRGIAEGRRMAHPFSLLAGPSSLAQQRRCAEIFAADRTPPRSDRALELPRYSHERIRLGYFSADFHSHATAYLAAGLFEHHDRLRFEVVGFSFGIASQDAMRKRLEKAFDRFIDVKAMTDREIADLSRSLEIDIAIDLKGFTQDSRPGIFAFRAAPVQVSYLGYPGTMGAGYMDYLLADRTVVPDEHLRNYSEKVVQLPHCYQVNDAKRAIANDTVCRADEGLPANAVVFCCFNNTYKITPDVFDLWMRLLRDVEGSVLWLLETAPLASANLRREAQGRGVDPQRLVFAPHREVSRHLARLRLADLVLDTYHCGAHTTATDALWAGVPVVTYLGETFASRVAASLLHAVGLEQLVGRSRAEYEALALGLARDPERLSAVRGELEKNRATHPLFDTGRFTRDIEAAFVAMLETGA